MNGNIPLATSEKTINVNGVILTEKAIDRLRWLQAHDNEVLKGMIRHLTDTARLLSTEWTQMDTDARELLGTISVTFDLCGYLESLFAEPEEGGES